MTDFNGLHVAAMESRRAEDMQRMIAKQGGIAHVSPSMREVPIEPNRAAIDFAYRVMTGEVSVIVLLTGVGFRYLLRAIEKHVGKQRFLDALSDCVTICRGPKPAAAMREVGLKPTHRVPEPNTWRELLQTIDESVPIANQVIGLQEYGISNASLIAGLEARGATVDCVKVYAWDLPEDTAPLVENIQAIAARRRDVVLLTSAHQVVNMLRMADSMHITDQLREGLRHSVIASIGPTTTQMLQECELDADMEPSHPKMGHLVIEAAKQSASLLQAKRTPNLQAKLTPTATIKVAGASMSDYAITPAVADPAPHPHADHPSIDSLFMKACRCEPTHRTPVWLMRQAGRYMAEYREVRAKVSFLELCNDPKLCSEVMCTAVDRLGVDAAIIFSDLLPILIPMGFDLEFVKGDGPVIHNPVRRADDLARIKSLDDPGQLDFVYETVRQTRADIPDDIPVIGFAGSPFTLASYAIEGGGSRQYANTKRLMLSNPDAWSMLMQRLSEAIVAYLNEQIAAGAQCVQLFDSWVGCLSPDDYRQSVLPWMKQIISGITPGVPVINFGTGNPELLPMMRVDTRTVVGVDWRVPITEGWRRAGHDGAVQGNLDPAVLLAEPDVIRSRVQEVLLAVDGRPGHIFNLGHGVFKETPVEHAIELIRCVQEFSQRPE